MRPEAKGFEVSAAIEQLKGFKSFRGVLWGVFGGYRYGLERGWMMVVGA